MEPLEVMEPLELTENIEDDMFENWVGDIAQDPVQDPDADQDVDPVQDPEDPEDAEDPEDSVGTDLDSMDAFLLELEDHRKKLEHLLAETDKILAGKRSRSIQIIRPRKKKKTASA